MTKLKTKKWGFKMFSKEVLKLYKVLTGNAMIAPDSRPPADLEVDLKYNYPALKIYKSKNKFPDYQKYLLLALTEAIGVKITNQMKEIAMQTQTINHLHEKQEVEAVKEAAKPGMPPVGSGARDFANGEWRDCVHEPPKENWKEIDKFIRSELGLHWTWEKEYVKNGQFAWCGAFVAWCYGNVGLKETIRKEHLASTYRIVEWAKKNKRMVISGTIEPGDIIVVGDKRDRWGQHITMADDAVLCSLGNSVNTIEGNARGTGPDNKVYEGVVRQTRYFQTKEEFESDKILDKYKIMHVVRFKDEDFE